MASFDLFPGTIQGKEGIIFCHLATLREGREKVGHCAQIDEMDEAEIAKRKQNRNIT